MHLMVLTALTSLSSTLRASTTGANERVLSCALQSTVNDTDDPHGDCTGAHSEYSATWVWRPSD